MAGTQWPPGARFSIARQCVSVTTVPLAARTACQLEQRRVDRLPQQQAVDRDDTVEAAVGPRYRGGARPIEPDASRCDGGAVAPAAPDRPSSPRDRCRRLVPAGVAARAPRRPVPGPNPTARTLPSSAWSSSAIAARSMSLLSRAIRPRQPARRAPEARVAARIAAADTAAAAPGPTQALEVDFKSMPSLPLPPRPARHRRSRHTIRDGSVHAALLRA